MGSDKQLNVNECSEEDIVRSAKDRVTLTVKCTPSKDAVITANLSVKRMFVLKKNEQGVFNKKMICTVPHMFLYYFDNESSENPRGIIDLHYYTDIGIEGDAGNILKISAPEESGLKSYYFQIDDATMMSDLITSLHRDKYAVIRDERDAYQQLQDQFSGEMEGASKQLVLSEQERETMKQEIASTKTKADEAMEALYEALRRFEVTEEELSSLGSLSRTGEALLQKIDDLRCQLSATVTENDKIISELEAAHSHSLQMKDDEIAAEKKAFSMLEASLQSDKRDAEQRAREAIALMERLKLNLQIAVDYKETADEKVAALTEQKKVLVKEVKQLRKKAEADQMAVERVNALNDQLAGSAEALQSQNMKLCERMAALESQVLRLSACSAALEGETSPQPSVSSDADSMLFATPHIDVSVLRRQHESIPELESDSREMAASPAQAAIAHPNVQSTETEAGDSLAWLSEEQNHKLHAGAPGRHTRPSVVMDMFLGHDKFVSKPSLSLLDDEPVDHCPATHTAQPTSQPAPLPTYSTTYAIMQALQPVEGKIYCLRCNGTVEGPKYSTCKCTEPALTPEMLSATTSPAASVASSVSSGVGTVTSSVSSGVGTVASTVSSTVSSGVGKVGSSLFGMISHSFTKAKPHPTAAPTQEHAKEGPPHTPPVSIREESDPREPH